MEIAVFPSRHECRAYAADAPKTHPQNLKKQTKTHKQYDLFFNSFLELSWPPFWTIFDPKVLQKLIQNAPRRHVATEFCEKCVFVTPPIHFHWF